MTNHERYQRAIQVLQSSLEENSMEEKSMMEMQNQKGSAQDMERVFAEAKKRRLYSYIGKAAAAALAVCLVTAAGTGIAYAANLGGLRDTVQVWFNGERQTAEIERTAPYEYKVYLENGEVYEGGGVAYEFGRERALTAEEIAEDIDGVHMTQEDGRQIVYYHDRSLDITELFDEEDMMYLEIELDDGSVLYADFERTPSPEHDGTYVCSGYCTSDQPTSGKHYVRWSK